MSIDTGSRVITRTLAALKASVPYILHQGGTSSGKTFGILYALLFYALEFLKPGSIISIVSQTLPHLKKGAINDFKTILAMTGMDTHVTENKSDHVFTLHNGTRFEFFAPENSEKAKSGKRDLLFMNEANSMMWSIATQLMMRTRGPIILDYNPSGRFWLHRELLKSIKESEYVFTRSTYRDNKSIDKNTIAAIERLRLIDQSLYDVYGEGIEGKSSDLIFPSFEIVDYFPDTDKLSNGLDFGYSVDPSAAVKCALNEGYLYFHLMFYERGLSNKDIYNRYELQTNPFGKTIADSAEPKSIAEIRGYGLDIIGATKGPDSVRFWIDRIKQYPMRVTKSSTELIDELESARWIVVDGQPTKVPKPGNDHGIAGMRYGVQGILSDAEPVRAIVQNAKRMGFADYGI